MLVKICGLKILEDARFAAAAGADLLGIVVSESSPRRASMDEARAILALTVPQPKYLVFGYDDAQYIRETFVALAVAGTRLQIMADHPQIEELLKLAPTELILPSISAAEKVTAVHVSRWERHPLVLFDSHRADAGGRVLRSVPRYAEGETPSALGNQREVYRDQRLAGGTGKTFSPENIAGIRRPYLYAGGLNADNVAGIVAKVNPPGVDVASGTEASPGVKDHGKVTRFILNAKKTAQMIQVQQ